MTDDHSDVCNLADPALGAAVIRVNDEFFAPAKRMLEPAEPVFIDDLYDHHGKWMDGWESRRKREPGHDFCVLRICPGVIYGVEIDTRHFTGNFAPAASLEACVADADPLQASNWKEVLPRVELQGNSRQYFCISDRSNWTHLRLNIFPDGGVARLRVFGRPEQAPTEPATQGWINLASQSLGARGLACNDMHYGAMDNLLKADESANMGDGWETRRRRSPGNDWVIIELGATGHVRKIEVDTAHFKGNSPAACSIRGSQTLPEQNMETAAADWPLILPKIALGPDQKQLFQREINDVGPVRYLRMDIFPDGGVARLRVLGEKLAED